MPEDIALPTFDLTTLGEMLRRQGVDARIPHGGDTSVSGLFIDSRKAVPGCLFLCKGAAFRPQFLADAVARGAAAFVCEGAAAGGAVPDGGEAELAVPDALAQVAPDVPAIVVSDVRRAMGVLSPELFGRPDERLRIAGITGTKGKSTTAYMLRAILRAGGIEPSILGSIETDDGIERFESHNTTPEAPDLWRHLHNSVAAGRTHLVMEVSSQGLKYDRVDGLHLEIGCFLNIGRDHISAAEHPNFGDYFASKLKIFDLCRTAVVNADTDHAEEVLAAAGRAPRTVTFGVDARDTDVRAENIAASAAGLEFDVVERAGFAAECGCEAGEGAGHENVSSRAEGAAGAVGGGASDAETAGGEETRHRIALGMAGLFNVSNALAAVAMARLMGVGYDAIAAGLAHVRVPGRMELVSSADGRVLAIVDYAHNELSFKTLFESVKAEYPGRKVVAVFGAPGGKAYERRAVLPQVAGRYADLIIYTEEDPAHDAVEDICAELSANTPAGVAHESIYDRERAVERAFEAAFGFDEPSVVLLLAKGDETRQHRGDEYPEIVSDLALAKRILEA